MSYNPKPIYGILPVYIIGSTNFLSFNKNILLNLNESHRNCKSCTQLNATNLRSCSGTFGFRKYIIYDILSSVFFTRHFGKIHSITFYITTNIEAPSRAIMRPIHHTRDHAWEDERAKIIFIACCRIL